MPGKCRVSAAYRGPASLESLAERWGLQLLDRVTVVEVSGEFTDQMLEPLLELRHLERLILTYTEASDAWIEQFQSKHPDCVVSVLHFE